MRRANVVPSDSGCDVKREPVSVDMRGFDRQRAGYRYVELRRRDIERLRTYRNAQMRVLRQLEPLTAEGQAEWYERSVLQTHRLPDPEGLLISILDEGQNFIGYGGLTHIDWFHRRGEVSFLVDPERAADEATYARDFGAFLEELKDWSFGSLGLVRLFTETFEFRTRHIELLEKAGFGSKKKSITFAPCT